MQPPSSRFRWPSIVLLAAALLAGAWWLLGWPSPSAPAPGAGAVASGAGRDAPARPALSVALVSPSREEWPRTISAQGNITPWQEASVGAELAGYRVTAVLVNVGDRVKKGQTLANLNAEGVAADVAQVRAAVAEAEAVLAEAKANATRSRDLASKGFLSAQALTQSATQEQTAAARLAAAKAKLQAEELRLAYTRVVAPDDGTISARTATIGAQAQPGLEMFRLIRGNRLEWRAEVTASELARIGPGVTALVHLPSGDDVTGTVRTIAPTVDPQTRNALVYVDLPVSDTSPARAGMFARGVFELGRTPALSLPQTAVLQREGFSYVFRLQGDSRVAQTKVSVGRRVGERIEIVEGLPQDAKVVASGAGFLADGDLVRVVDAPAMANR